MILIFSSEWTNFIDIRVFQVSAGVNKNKYTRVRWKSLSSCMVSKIYYLEVMIKTYTQNEKNDLSLLSIADE